MNKHWKTGQILTAVLWVGFLQSPSSHKVPSVASGIELLPGQTATLLPDGRWLLIGGMNPIPLPNLFIHDPETGAVASLGHQLERPRAYHTASLLPDGSILVLGGVGPQNQVIGSAELIVPGVADYELTTLEGLSRAHHSATLLSDGRVVVAGGIGEDGALKKDIELWDAATLRSEVFDLPSGGVQRRDHSAHLRTDGAVQIEGGVDSLGQRVDYLEVYDPNRNELYVESETAAPDEPPYLAFSFPTNGAINVPNGIQIALRFSRLLRVETVNVDTVRIHGPGGYVAAKVVPTEEGRLAFINPEKPLVPGATYTVTVEGTSDLRGQPMVVASFSFMTAAREADDEEWIPSAECLKFGNCRSGRPDSRWRSLPPLQAASGVTAVAGQVLKLNGQPLKGVTLDIDGVSAETDSTGRFLLEDVEPGRHEMLIDGSSAGTPDKKFGLFEVGIDITEGHTNALSYTIWMPKIDTAHAVTLPYSIGQELTITTPHIPGLELHIPPGTRIYDRDGHHVSEVSITPIPVDRPPFPLPAGVDVPVYFTIQPGGAYVHTVTRTGERGARLIYPNYRRERPGTRANFWHYDPEERGWYVYGHGTVTPDGTQVVPDPGVAIYEFTGAMINAGLTPPDTGPAPGEDASDGDPVDLGTGLFVLRKTDLHLPDLLPIVLTRTYRQGDTGARPFGIGATHPYAIFLWSANQYQEADLILPDGGRVHYLRISEGIGFTDAVFEHTTTPTAFYKSRMAWNGNGWDLTLRDGTVYVFGDEAPLQSIRDRYGNETTITWSSTNEFGSGAGNITRITSPSGRWIEFTYDASDRITEAKDNIGRTVAYTYDAGGRLSTVTDTKGGVTTYTYDASHRLLTITDARSIHYLTNTYDPTSGRIIKQTLADPNVEYEFDYTIDAGTSKVIQTDVTHPRENVRRVTFNAEGYMTSDTYALGDPNLERTTTYGRLSGSNLVETVTDEFERVTKFTYVDGQVDTITRLFGTPEAVTTDIHYEPNFGLVSKITDALNHSTDFEYDGLGNLTRIVDAEMNATRIEYNSAGQPTAAIDPNGEATTFVYSLGDLTQVIDPLDNVANAFTDAVGRVRSVTDAVGNVTWYDYDGLNQLKTITDALGGVTSFEYDGNGNMLTVTDARQNVVSYIYDDFDRLKTRTDALGDPENPVSDPNHYEAYEYDGNGNLTRHTDRRGKVTTLRYDALDRLEFAGFGTTGMEPNLMFESTITYAYDDPNNRVTLTDSETGAVILEYDDLGRLTTETTPNGSVSYTYDAADRLETLTVAGETTVVYDYYDNNQLNTVTQGSKVVSLDYYPTGRRKTLSLPNSISTTYTFDVASRLTGLEYKHDTTTVGDLGYGYDARGLRTSVDGTFARTGLPAPISSAAYDAANRLEQWGNIGTVLYDNNGSLAFDGTNTLIWNSRDQLESITGGVSATFEYDSLGRRLRRTLGSETTNYTFAGVNIVREESSETALLLPGLEVDEFFARVDGFGERVPIVDGISSTIALLDPSGGLAAEYSYEPFGSTAISGEPNKNASRFTGREDDGSGFYYYRARYISPALHRFVSEDPLDLRGGDINLYVYALNSPTNYNDPSGLFADILADAFFIGLDIYELSTAGRKDRDALLLDLNLDLLGAAIPGITGLGRANKLVRGFNANQDALIQLAKEARRKGVTTSEAQTLLEWAVEYGVKPALNHINTTHWVGGPHIRVGPVNHIRVR